MEKRSNPRLQRTYDVELIVNGYVHASVRSRDLGLGGTFLEMGKSLPPPPGTEIDLLFHAADKQQTALPASVTRVSLDGIGCRFDNIADRQLSGLKKLLES